MASTKKLKPLPEDWERAVCIVAHPDDLEYGPSSAVARWTSQGKEVSYILVTRGEAGIDSMNPTQAGRLREQEQRASAKVVGVETVEFLDHRDGLIQYGLPLRRDVARVIRRFQPEVLVSINHHLTWGQTSLNMADHRAVGMAVLDGARDAANRWLYPELGAVGLEPWKGVRMACFSGTPEPTHAVDVTGHIDQGIASLREHATYIAELGGDFDPDGFLRRGAAYGGKRLGTEYAIAFEVYDL